MSSMTINHLIISGVEKRVWKRLQGIKFTTDLFLRKKQRLGTSQEIIHLFAVTDGFGLELCSPHQQCLQIVKFI